MADVIVWGDSIPASCADYFTFFYALRGWSTEMHTWGGTAPCDWLDDMMECSAPAHAAVVSFSGNQITPCMTNRMRRASGSKLIAQDLNLVGKTFRQRGFERVLFCSPPGPVGSVTGTHWIIPILKATARKYSYQYFDAGAILAQPDGIFHTWMGCEQADINAGWCYLGVVNVREDDGAHLRPSGQRRYAAAIVNAT